MLSSAKTVIPIDNHSNTLKRNNSLVNSSKVVNKRQKNDNIEIVQNNDIIQVRSYSNDDPSYDESIASDKEFERFMMIPTRTNGDPNLFRALASLEQEVRVLMRQYGINDDLLEKNVEQGPRSEIIGIYRILVQRIKAQKEQISIVSHQSPLNNNKNNNRSNSSKSNHTNATNDKVKKCSKSEKKKNSMCAIL
jgi:hypothetical protein